MFEPQLGPSHVGSRSPTATRVWYGNKRMAKLIDVVAVYKLPASLKVSEGCFGKNFTVTIGRLTGKAATPTIAWIGEDDRPHVVAPSADEVVKRCVEHYTIKAEDGWESWHYWGRVDSWSPEKRVAGIAHVGALLLRFKIDPSQVTYSDYPPGRGIPRGKPVDALFSDVDKWFERVRLWIEAAVDQDTNPRAPLSSTEVGGDGLQMFTVEKETVSLPARARVVNAVWHKSEKVKLPTLRRIIKHANRGTFPSDAQMLLLDSRAAKRRGQYRRAVIDAGAATEMTLADLNRRATIVNPPGKPTLGWYVTQPAIAARAGSPASAKADLVDVRNSAIHQHLVPTLAETEKALAIAKQILDNVDPLPL